ncbi:MAG: MFS transporter [Gammaproteobacteria bacterium]|nr:MFS transporter [Gammaproteobacteria bacterium]
MLYLLKFRGFSPYISIVFLNAFVDLGHKIIVQNTVFKIYDGREQVVLTAIVNALILIPFILLMSPAGFCSDKYPKNLVVRVTSLAAVVLTLLITLFYYLGWFWPAFAMTFLLAVQSAIYSPAKYGYIRELVGDDNLARANGLVQATTTVSILAGIFLFSILFEELLAGHAYNNRSELLQLIAPIGWCLVLISLGEFALAFLLPQKQPLLASMRFEWQQYFGGHYLRFNLQSVREHAVIIKSIVGLALFWAISQVMLAAFPAYTKETMFVTNTVVIQGMLACAGFGIVAGSVIAGAVSRRGVEIRLIPAGAIGIAICLFVLPTLENTIGLSLNFLIWGMMGGFVIIPLNTLIQHHAKEGQLGRVISASNLIQNCVMLSFLAMTVVFALMGLKSLWLIHILQIVAILAALLALAWTMKIWARPGDRENQSGDDA